MSDGIDRELLTSVLADMTDNGKNMERLPHIRNEVTYWLREQGRMHDAKALQRGAGFVLRGDYEGRVEVYQGVLRIILNVGRAE